MCVYQFKRICYLYVWCVEHSEGLCCSLWGDPQGSYEMGSVRHQVPPAGTPPALIRAASLSAGTGSMSAPVQTFNTNA